MCSEGPQKDSGPDENGILAPTPWEVNPSAPCTEEETETEEAQPGGTQVHQAMGRGGGALSSAKLPHWEWGREALPGIRGYLGTAYLSTVGHSADGPLLPGAPAVEPGVTDLLHLLNDLHDLGRAQPSCHRHVVLRAARHVAEGERLVLGVVQDLATGVDGATPGHVEVAGDKADDDLGAAVVPVQSGMAPLGSHVRLLSAVLGQATVAQRGRVCLAQWAARVHHPEWSGLGVTAADMAVEMLGNIDVCCHAGGREKKGHEGLSSCLLKHLLCVQP